MNGDGAVSFCSYCQPGQDGKIPSSALYLAPKGEARRALLKASERALTE